MGLLGEQVNRIYNRLCEKDTEENQFYLNLSKEYFDSADNSPLSDNEKKFWSEYITDYVNKKKRNFIEISVCNDVTMEYLKMTNGYYDTITEKIFPGDKREYSLETTTFEKDKYLIRNRYPGDTAFMGEIILWDRRINALANWLNSEGIAVLYHKYRKSICLYPFDVWNSVMNREINENLYFQRNIDFNNVYSVTYDLIEHYKDKFDRLYKICPKMKLNNEDYYILNEKLIKKTW